MSFRIGYDGVSTGSLTQLLSNVEGNLNTWAFRVSAQTDSGSSGSPGSAPGSFAAIITPCPTSIGPHEPNCIHREDLVHDEHTYIGAAIGIGVALPAGIIVGIVIGYGIAKMLGNSAGGSPRRS